jgi:hypothetical protein
LPTELASLTQQQYLFCIYPAKFTATTVDTHTTLQLVYGYYGNVTPQAQATFLMLPANFCRYLRHSMSQTFLDHMSLQSVALCSNVCRNSLSDDAAYVADMATDNMHSGMVAAADLVLIVRLWNRSLLAL